jgi:uncharacterized protein with HEPN domain
VKRYLIALQDILDSIDKIESYIEGADYDSYSRNSMLSDAVIRNLEIIGEASGKIPEEIRIKYPKIPWKKMVGLRNILIHEYFGVDDSIIWEIITTNLPATKPEVMRAVLEEDRD